jgi:hypothetical protein
VAKQPQRIKYKRKFFKDDLVWLEKNQKPNKLTKVMKHQNKPWYWCSPATGGKCEGCWRGHEPSECKGMAVPGPNRGGKVNSGCNEQQLRMMQELTLVFMEESEKEQENNARLMEELDE